MNRSSVIFKNIVCNIKTGLNVCNFHQHHKLHHLLHRNRLLGLTQSNTILSKYSDKYSNNVNRISLLNIPSLYFSTYSTLYKEDKFQSFKLPVEDQQQQQQIQIGQVKKRPPRKKTSIKKEDEKEILEVVAFSTAEEYDFDSLSNELKNQGLYEPIVLPEDVEDVLYVKAKYEVQDVEREICFFREGSVVFWNVPVVERKTVLLFLRSFEINPYDIDMVYEEKEEIDFKFADNSKTRLQNGLIYLNNKNNAADNQLFKYTFSNSIALSVKLAIWEASLDRYIDSIGHVTKDIKQGGKVRLTRDQVFRKTGELFALRHHINLSSDLLDTPDFYWDRQELEKIFINTCQFLNINKRTKVMNEKLNHCLELMSLLSSHLNDNHHVRLEWMIIILIMVEVVFEFIHYAERLF